MAPAIHTTAESAVKEAVKNRYRFTQESGRYLLAEVLYNRFWRLLSCSTCSSPPSGRPYFNRGSAGRKTASGHPRRVWECRLSQRRPSGQRCATLSCRKYILRALDVGAIGEEGVTLCLKQLLAVLPGDDCCAQALSLAQDNIRDALLQQDAVVSVPTETSLPSDDLVPSPASSEAVIIQDIRSDPLPESITESTSRKRCQSESLGDSESQKKRLCVSHLDLSIPCPSSSPEAYHLAGSIPGSSQTTALPFSSPTPAVKVQLSTPDRTDTDDIHVPTSSAAEPSTLIVEQLLIRFHSAKLSSERTGIRKEAKLKGLGKEFDGHLRENHSKIRKTQAQTQAQADQNNKTSKDSRVKGPRANRIKLQSGAQIKGQLSLSLTKNGFCCTSPQPSAQQ